MPYADLQSARRSKQTRSYVNTTPVIPTEQSDASNRNADESSFHAASDDALYRSLPQSLQVRSSNRMGRGIWTKDKAMPGMVYSIILFTSF